MRQMTNTLGTMSPYENDGSTDAWAITRVHGKSEYNSSALPLVNGANDLPTASPDSSERSPKSAKNGTAKKKVSFQLSDIRRYSLTGSLPDLAKASQHEVKASTSEDQLELNIKRDPLPLGSDTFRAAMDEIDSDSDPASSNENISDSLSHSWNGSTPGRRGPSKQRFQSKAAAAIYCKLFPMSKDHHHTAVHSPRRVNHDVKSSPDWSPCSSTSSSPQTSCPSSPGLMARHSPVPRHTNPSTPTTAHRLSPLVSGQIGHVRVSSDKIGIRRQVSMPAESPRLLQRTKYHHTLTKSASLDR